MHHKEKYFLKLYLKQFLIVRVIRNSIKKLAIRIAYYKRHLRYRAVADPDKIITVKVVDIKYILGDKGIRRRTLPGKIINTFGNMKITPKHKYDQESIKYKAIFEHFSKNVPWEKTELFKVGYKYELEKKGSVRGCSTIEELAIEYKENIDSLYEDIKRNGIKLPSKEDPEIECIFVHIGPAGEIIYTSNGNHRLAMAKCLGIQSIPCKVWWRHEKWQNIRDHISLLTFDEINKLYPELMDHPDLQDILSALPECCNQEQDVCH